jgi:formylglycine-generating enzyme required for sulfatase activity
LVPVTQAQWQAVVGCYPSHFKGDDLPVEGVSWEDYGGDAVDPVCPTQSCYRVIRGGSWCFRPLWCRSAFRDGILPGRRYNDLGCRLVLVSSG